MKLFFDILAFLAPYKKDQSSALHVFMDKSGWPNPPGAAWTIREDHYFGAPTITRVVFF